VAGRKIIDEAEARALLAELEASRLHQGTFARRRGIDGRSLNAWRVNLSARRARRSPTALRVVELVANAPAAPSPSVTVRCGPFTVDVRADVDDALLGRVLAAVAAC
jgi:hypothetical protein